MQINETSREVCDYCYKTHLQYANDHSNFDMHNKVGKTECISCNGVMCEQCKEHSKRVTKGVDMEFCDSFLCADCCMGVWIKSDFQERLISVFQDLKTEMRKRAKQQISSLQPSFYPVRSGRGR